MNERYLFRGKRTDNGKWQVGLLARYNEKYPCANIIDEMELLIPVETKTVGQCTGLKDKNGKLIFENDIVVTDIFNTPEIKYTITYDKELAAFIGEYRKGCIKHFTTFDSDSNCFEVIGNIHDNPELLEKLIRIN